ncbi:hypothetical protein BV25DRAFT_1995394 [Artomyces pyxidatus]|uniref:Uncharacterized protein n=1 Tax=Artomyces pyxidatus TaxID=48021 RepID=A0ACB8SM67_9AGAM|nr:hypothetical protein BV25DRAFT_1995394 [Artomyces pyxidatus]
MAQIAIKILKAVGSSADVFPPLKSAAEGALYIAKTVQCLQTPVEIQTEQAGVVTLDEIVTSVDGIKRQRSFKDGGASAQDPDKISELRKHFDDAVDLFKKHFSADGHPEDSLYYEDGRTSSHGSSADDEVRDDRTRLLAALNSEVQAVLHPSYLAEHASRLARAITTMFMPSSALGPNTAAVAGGGERDPADDRLFCVSTYADTVPSFSSPALEAEAVKKVSQEIETFGRFAGVTFSQSRTMQPSKNSRQEIAVDGSVIVTDMRSVKEETLTMVAYDVTFSQYLNNAKVKMAARILEDLSSGLPPQLIWVGFVSIDEKRKFLLVHMKLMPGIDYSRARKLNLVIKHETEWSSLVIRRPLGPGPASPTAEPGSATSASAITTFRALGGVTKSVLAYSLVLYCLLSSKPTHLFRFKSGFVHGCGEFRCSL